MAACDYRSCDVCGCKAFYDANLSYEHTGAEADGDGAFKVCGDPQPWGLRLGNLGDWAVLCDDCSKTYRTQIVRKVEE